MTRLGWGSRRILWWQNAPWARLLGMIPCSYGVRNVCSPNNRHGIPAVRIDSYLLHEAGRSMWHLLSRTGEVLAVCREVAPWRVLSCREAASVDRENCAMRPMPRFKMHIWFDSSEDMAGRFGFDAVERQNRSNG